MGNYPTIEQLRTEGKLDLYQVGVPGGWSNISQAISSEQARQAAEHWTPGQGVTITNPVTGAPVYLTPEQTRALPLEISAYIKEAPTYSPSTTASAPAAPTKDYSSIINETARAEALAGVAGGGTTPGSPTYGVVVGPSAPFAGKMEEAKDAATYTGTALQQYNYPLMAGLPSGEQAFVSSPVGRAALAATESRIMTEGQGIGARQQYATPAYEPVFSLPSTAQPIDEFSKQLATAEKTGLPVATIQANWLTGEKFAAKYAEFEKAAAPVTKTSELQFEKAAAPVTKTSELQFGTMSLVSSAFTTPFSAPILSTPFAGVPVESTMGYIRPENIPEPYSVRAEKLVYEVGAKSENLFSFFREPIQTYVSKPLESMGGIPAFFGRTAESVSYMPETALIKVPAAAFGVGVKYGEAILTGTVGQPVKGEEEAKKAVWESATNPEFYAQAALLTAVPFVGGKISSAFIKEVPVKVEAFPETKIQVSTRSALGETQFGATSTAPFKVTYAKTLGGYEIPFSRYTKAGISYSEVGGIVSDVPKVSMAAKLGSAEVQEPMLVQTTLQAESAIHPYVEARFAPETLKITTEAPKTLAEYNKGITGVTPSYALERGGTVLAKTQVGQPFEKTLLFASWEAKVPGYGYGKELIRGVVSEFPETKVIRVNEFTEVGERHFVPVMEELGFARTKPSMFVKEPPAFTEQQAPPPPIEIKPISLEPSTLETTKLSVSYPEVAKGMTATEATPLYRGVFEPSKLPYQPTSDIISSRGVSVSGEGITKGVGGIEELKVSFKDLFKTEQEQVYEIRGTSGKTEITGMGKLTTIDKGFGGGAIEEGSAYPKYVSPRDVTSFEVSRSSMRQIEIQKTAETASLSSTLKALETPKVVSASTFQRGMILPIVSTKTEGYTAERQLSTSTVKSPTRTAINPTTLFTTRITPSLVQPRTIIYQTGIIRNVETTTLRTPELTTPRTLEETTTFTPELTTVRTPEIVTPRTPELTTPKVPTATTTLYPPITKPPTYAPPSTPFQRLPPIPPPFWLPSFKDEGGGVSRKRFKKKVIPRKYRYTPSIYASMERIRGPVSKRVLSSEQALSGLEMRPIPGRLPKVSIKPVKASKTGFKMGGSMKLPSLGNMASLGKSMRFGSMFKKRGKKR